LTREFLALAEYLGVRSCYCFARIPEGYWQNSRWREPPVTKSRSFPSLILLRPQPESPSVMLGLTLPAFSPPYGLHVLHDGVSGSRALLLRYTIQNQMSQLTFNLMLSAGRAPGSSQPAADQSRRTQKTPFWISEKSGLIMNICNWAGG
jgi:hypothetical protein